MDQLLDQSREVLIQALGRQSLFWGLGKTVGEIYAALYTSPEPLPLEEVAKRLQMTKGNISISIRQLEQLGMVRRSWQRGDRRVFFEAETDFWKITHMVLGLRHKQEFDQSFILVEESARLAEEANPSGEKDCMLERLKSLQEFYQVLDGAVEAALDMGPERLRAAVDVLRSLSRENK